MLASGAGRTAQLQQLRDVSYNKRGFIAVLSYAGARLRARARFFCARLLLGAMGWALS